MGVWILVDLFWWKSMRVGVTVVHRLRIFCGTGKSFVLSIFPITF